MDLGQWFEFTMDPLQMYGLMFVLGSYSVATLSDLKRMSAQSEFVSVWAIIAIGLFVVDVYLVGTDQNPWDMFAVKSLLIVALSILSHELHLHQGGRQAGFDQYVDFPVLLPVEHLLLQVGDGD